MALPVCYHTGCPDGCLFDILKDETETTDLKTTGEKNASCAPLYTITRRFTKTGLGQTQGKLKKKRTLSRSCRCADLQAYDRAAAGNRPVCVPNKPQRRG